MSTPNPTVSTGDSIFGREEGPTWWRETVLQVTYVSDQNTLAIARFERSSLTCAENPGHTRWVASSGRELAWSLAHREWSILTDLEVEAIVEAITPAEPTGDPG